MQLPLPAHAGHSQRSNCWLHLNWWNWRRWVLSLILTHLLINPISTCPIMWLSSTDCRGFPPTAGLSFSCWFQINRFSSACDSHPIRLLSVVRHMSRTEQQYICLSISFSAYDGCLVISTEEEAFTYLGKKQTKKMVQFFFSSSASDKFLSVLLQTWWSQKFALLPRCLHHWGCDAPACWSQVSGTIWL